jgi:hypothetical protein
MPRIIVKCRYLKSGKKSHLSNMVKYIATREGVDKLDDGEKDLPSTHSQQKLIAGIVQELPETVELFEYADYLKEQTRGSAYEFICSAIDKNYDLIGEKKNYVEYIANRPHVDKIGCHGLFTSTDDPINISKVAEEVSAHQGNVWTNIISLRREDAARLGYDNAKMWRTLLRSHANEIADNMKIAPENFQWYAAMHNQSHHPHVHLIAYSIDPKEAYLSEQGIENIRASLAKDIFRQDHMQIFTEQTKIRDELTRESKNVIFDIVSQIEYGSYQNIKVENLLSELSEKLKNTSGKKVYGYLNADMKMLIDNIVDEMAKDARFAKLYDLWYEQRYEALRTYADTMPPKQPLSKQKEFKSIKNIVIAEAMNLSNNNADLNKNFEPEDMHFNDLQQLKSKDSETYAKKKESSKVEYAKIPVFSANNILISNALISLFKNCSRILINEISKENRNELQVDKKLRREIEEKKHAQGIRI